METKNTLGIRLFPYFGAKTYFLKEIYSLIPEHESFIDLFGGSLCVILNKPKSAIECANDISRDIINLAICLRDHPEEVFHEQNLPNSRAYFYYCQNILRSQCVRFGDIHRAAYYLYWSYKAYSGVCSWGHLTKSRTKQKRMRLSYANQISERLHHIQLECQDYKRVIETWDHPNAFFFIDPPYVNISSRGRYAGGMFSHKQLRDILQNIEGRFLLTYNDHPRVKKLYERGPYFNHYRPETGRPYSTNHATDPKPISELWITNYELDFDPFIDFDQSVLFEFPEIDQASNSSHPDYKSATVEENQSSPT